METGHLNPPLTRRLPGLAVAAMASLGAGAIHAAATGIHAEHPELARLFVVVTVAQLGVGLWALLRPTRLAAWAVAGVNAGAVGGWLATRLTGISWIPGLEVSEAPQFADPACALLGAVATTPPSTRSLATPSPTRTTPRPARLLLPVGRASGIPRSASTSPAYPASAPSNNCGPTSSSRTRCATCRSGPTPQRRSPTGTRASAMPAQGWSTTSRARSSRTTCCSIRRSPSRSSIRSTATSERSPERCSSPAPGPPTTPSSPAGQAH